MKKVILTSAFLLFCALIMALTLRGHLGTPTGTELLDPYWMSNGPFELSPERGRYALLYSLVENQSFIFDLPIARFATPDVAILNGKYVSLFAPLVSFIAIPGYMLGKTLGAAQVGAFAVISLFALVNLFLIRTIAIKLGAKKIPATIASMAFIFATPAFAYGVSLYQHHISTFLILASIYLLLRWNNFLSLSLVWFLFAASIPVDYPNLILMLPIAIFATGKMIWVSTKKSQANLNINLLKIITPISIVLPLLFYVWFSSASYGKPFQLAGTLNSTQAIDEKGKPVSAPSLSSNQETSVSEFEEDQKKSATGFFKTRNLLNGLYIHTVSPDRGILFFTPIVIFGIIGAFILWSKWRKEVVLVTGIIGVNLVLYSMWGDPWGGWAFGSRYLIPSYALLSILSAATLTKFSRKLIFGILFFLVALYSVAVNTLGALTISANPPQVEVLGLEKQTGREEKYTYERNWQYLNEKGSKSFAYNTYFKNYLKPVEYYWLITAMITLVLGGLLVSLYLSKNK